MNKRILTATFCAALALLNSCTIASKRTAVRSYVPEGPPSVTLKSGETVEGSEVRLRDPLIGRARVEVDGQEYPARDVAFYQTESERFASIGKSSFAEQIKGGRLNMYRTTEIYTTTNSNGGTSMRHRTVDYIQKGDTGRVQMMSLSTIRTMVQDYPRARNIMLEERKLARTQRIVSLGAVGGGLAGLGLVALGVSQYNKDATRGTAPLLGGLGLMAASGGTLFVSYAIFGSKRQAKAYEAFEAYNKQR